MIIIENSTNTPTIENNSLCVGLEVKNYKEMCQLLGEKSLEGNSKKSQLKDWKLYFDYEKIGQKFLITEIYDEPLQKQDSRLMGNNSIYVKYIELLLMCFLSNKEGYTHTFRKIDLYTILGLVNKNYQDYLYGQCDNELKDGIISDFDIKDFYRHIPSKLDKIIFSALRNMKNRCLLEYFEEYIIVETVNTEKIYRVATEFEIKKIVEVRNDILKSMGLQSMTQVFFKFLSAKFYNGVNQLLYERFGWDYTYKQYKIIYSQKCIQSDIPITKIQIEKMALNQKVIDAVNTQAETRYYKNQDDYDKAVDEVIANFDGIGKPHIFEGDIKLFRYKDTYLDAQKELTNYFMRLK